MHQTHWLDHELLMEAIVRALTAASISSCSFVPSCLAESCNLLCTTLMVVLAGDTLLMQLKAAS